MTLADILRHERKFSVRPYPNRYYCVFCMKMLVSDQGVFVHDEVPHAFDFAFDDEQRTQNG